MTIPADGSAQVQNPSNSSVPCYLTIGAAANVIDEYLDFSYINGS